MSIEKAWKPPISRQKSGDFSVKISPPLLCKVPKRPPLLRRFLSGLCAFFCEVLARETTRCGIRRPESAADVVVTATPSYHQRKALYEIRESAWHHGRAVYGIIPQECMESAKRHGTTAEPCMASFRRNAWNPRSGMAPRQSRVWHHSAGMHGIREAAWHRRGRRPRRPASNELYFVSAVIVCKNILCREATPSRSVAQTAGRPGRRPYDGNLCRTATPTRSSTPP